MGRYELPACRWRTPGYCPGRQGCTSEIVGRPAFGVPDHLCFICQNADHPDPNATASIQERAGSIRHLLYHVYPVTDTWRWNIAQVRRRISLFNGKRMVAAAIGPETASIDEVKDALAGLDVQLLEVANNQELREMASYPLLLASLKNYRSTSDCTYYGHAKGVTSEKWGDGVRRWTESMYGALLDHWPAVRRELVDHCCCGIWQRHWPRAHGGRSAWHYSGAHRWTRNADLYARAWEDIDRNWVGSETHPGMLFTQRESSCLYGSFSTQDLGLYLGCEWQRRAAGEREAWESAHVADLEQPFLVTVLLSAAKQPELVHEAIRSVQAQTTDSWQCLIVDAGELSAAGAYDRYRLDARIQVLTTGETPATRAAVGIQAWAINRAWESGRVRGDLVCCLCEDDAFDPDWLRTCIAAARANPDVGAWYGWAERQTLGRKGLPRTLGRLKTVGIAGRDRLLRGSVDGMQLCCRRQAWRSWPEEKAIAFEADGWWMDAVAGETPAHPLDARVGWHRHTPLSTFTKAAATN